MLLRQQLNQALHRDRLQPRLLPPSFLGPCPTLPLQDMPGLGDESRLPAPGTVGKNWCWRADPALLTDARAAWLRGLAQQTGR